MQRRRDFLLSSMSAPLDRGEWASLIAKIEQQTPKLMQEFHVPGVSIAIVSDARFQWRRGFGVEDGESDKPVTPDTIFEAASMSKPLFAYAVMKLVERGVLNLDTPLTKYASERFLKHDARLHSITARHVLSHTCGFQNWRSDENPLKIHFNPGERFEYSGEGYNYLQSVVSKLTRQSFETYMQANLLRPLAMRASGYV